LCRATAVRIRNVSKESAVSNDIVLKMPNGVLEPDKPFKVFDMKKFQQNMNRELKRPVPDRNKLVKKPFVNLGSRDTHSCVVRERIEWDSSIENVKKSK